MDERETNRPLRFMNFSDELTYHQLARSLEHARQRVVNIEREMETIRMRGEWWWRINQDESIKH